MKNTGDIVFTSYPIISFAEMGVVLWRGVVYQECKEFAKNVWEIILWRLSSAINFNNRP